MTALETCIAALKAGPTDKLFEALERGIKDRTALSGRGRQRKKPPRLSRGGSFSLSVPTSPGDYGVMSIPSFASSSS